MTTIKSFQYNDSDNTICIELFNNDIINYDIDDSIDYDILYNIYEFIVLNNKIDLYKSIIENPDLENLLQSSNEDLHLCIFDLSIKYDDLEFFKLSCDNTEFINNYKYNQNLDDRKEELLSSIEKAKEYNSKNVLIVLELLHDIYYRIDE